MRPSAAVLIVLSLIAWLAITYPPASHAQGYNNGTLGTTNQQTATGSAVALTPNVPTVAVCIRAALANTGVVYAGVSGVTTGTGFELPTTVPVCIPVSRTGQIYIIGTGSVSWYTTSQL